MNKVIGNIRLSLQLQTFGIIAACIMLAACSSNEYPDLKYTPNNEESLNNEVPGTIAITPTLDCSSLFYTSASRGSGAFDHDHYLEDFTRHYLSSKFYILAYRRSTQTGELSVPTDFTQLMNYGTNSDRRECLLSTDKTVLGSAENRGKTTMPIDFTGALKFLDDETATQERFYYWNVAYGTTGYDFFGYYLDDAIVSNVAAMEDRTTIDVTIDGTQDLMVGAAPEVTAELLEQHYPGVTEQETKDKIVTYGEGAYSTYGAGHSVQPEISMKHCLARIMVFCKQMDGRSDITVKSLKLKARTNGTMTVAARNKRDLGFRASGDYKWLPLPNVTVPLEYGSNVLLGPGVMIPEEDNYDLEMTFEEKYIKDDNTTSTKTNVYTITLSPNDNKFRAGTAYYVVLTMWGMTITDVQVSTELHWKDGGDIDVGMQE